MIRVGRLVWERGYVAATDGNLSARLGDGRILVTASGLSKGFLSVDDLLVVDLDGRVTEAPRVEGQQPSSELLLHLEVYRQRPDVLAVIHAHPPLATAFGIAGESLDRCVLPEVTVTLGGIPTMTYATPGTQAVPDSIHDAIRDHDALLLAHHGSLTVGRTLWEAYLRLEKVEHAAQILTTTCQLGGVRELPSEEESRLREKRQAWLQSQGRD
jgi:L-fuculose-phosphate aldolase